MATAGGADAATAAIVSSSMTPGPLGISDTSPSADAPAPTARRASSTSRMQQILTRTAAAMGLSARARAAAGQRAHVIGEGLVVQGAGAHLLESKT